MRQRTNAARTETVQTLLKEAAFGPLSFPVFLRALPLSLGGGIPSHQYCASSIHEAATGAAPALGYHEATSKC